MTRSRAERLAAAARLDFDARAQALHEGPVRPRWAADGLSFWYATRAGRGIEHRWVDVAQRRQGPLFDAAALAAALQAETGTPVDASALPLTEVERSDDGGCSFVAFGCHWHWNAGGRDLSRLHPAWAAHEAQSPDGRFALSLHGADLRLRQLGSDDSIALTDDGEPDHGWGDFRDFVSQIAVRQGPPGPAPSVLWSPDSRRFAVFRVDRRSLPRARLLQASPPDGGAARDHVYPYPTPRHGAAAPLALWIIGRDGQRVQAALDVHACNGFTPLAAGACRWSRDGRWFCFVDGSRDARRFTLWRVDAASGRAERLFEDSGAAIVLPSPSINEPPIFHLLADGRVIVWSQRSGFGHLWMVAPAGRAAPGTSTAARPITQGEWQVRGLLYVDETAGRLAFLGGGHDSGGGADPCLNAVYAIDFDGDGLCRLTPEATHHEAWAATAAVRDGSFSPCGRWFVDNHGTVQQPPVALLRDLHGHPWMTLNRARASAGSTFWPADMPLPEPFSVTALDGHTPLWGLLYKPAGFDAAARYPVIEVIYGAPQTTATPKGWLPNRFGNLAEQLAALGFVVMIVDGPGTPYRSHAFQCRVHGRIESCGGLPDHVHALHALAATRPWMDLDRIGIVGASGGGYATVRAMAEFPAVYTVGVAMCGNHDQADYVAMWGERYQGLYDEALYAGQANTRVAARIEGALLLIHGDMDDNVHPSHTQRLADTLEAAGRRFELMWVANAGHMVVLLPQVQQRLWNFFLDRLLAPSAPD